MAHTVNVRDPLALWNRTVYIIIYLRTGSYSHSGKLHETEPLRSYMEIRRLGTVGVGEQYTLENIIRLGTLDIGEQ